MERAIIFNSKKETWDYFCRKFVADGIKNASMRPTIAQIEYTMAKKADATADIVWFDETDYKNNQEVQDAAIKMNQ